MNDNTRLESLRHDIEQMLSREMKTPKDFEFLSQQIYARLHIMMSTSTLKRIWGYLNEGNTPRESTLSILAQFAGYRNWQTYTDRNDDEQEVQSKLILSRSLSAYALEKGDRIIVTWLPDRCCRLEYLGDCHFIVLESKNAKLDAGDTFECHIFIEGEPLYIDNLHHAQYKGISYVAGKKDGIRYEVEGTEKPLS